MTREALLNQDWADVVERLGGAELLARSARETRAFMRPRVIQHAADLLRLVLAYSLGKSGLRATAAWAVSIGLVDLSNVALLYRLRQCGDWLSWLMGRVLAADMPHASQGRLIRIVDATAVPQAGPAARKRSKVWRIHSGFELPRERFGHFELTDQREGERLDRIPVVKGEIRIGDRADLQPERIAAVLADGGDVVVRAGWKSGRWCDAAGKPVDLIAELADARTEGLIDRPIAVARKSNAPLPLRLIAIRKPKRAAEAARRKARRNAQREGHQISKKTLTAADWVILVTSLPPDRFSTADILALYRLRWRIELAFKRLKSLIGLQGPPGVDARSARPYLLAHLLMILLLEPLVDELEDSPRSANAA
jgi:hypothetical protein